MSGKPESARSVYIPAPTGGINLIASPFDFKPNEARQLSNYWVTNWGIRQRPAWSAIANMAANIINIVPFTRRTSGNPFCFYVQDNGGAAAVTLKEVNPPTFGTVTAYTGPALSASNATTIYDMHIFGQYIYISGTPSTIRVYADTLAQTYLAFPFTGPTELADMWDYKKRFYGIEKNSATYWYGPLASYSGAMTSVDLSTIIPSGAPLLFGTSWSYNQGLSNEDLTVLVSLQGDVLVYSGDYPDASNWNLVWRGKIPKPVTDSTRTKKCFVQVGQDIYIGTERGVVSLKTFVQGSALQGQDYYLISRNLGDITLYPVNPAFDQYDPYIYFHGATSGGLPGPGGSANGAAIFVLNYETGAWSIFGGAGLAASSTDGSIVAQADRIIATNRTGSASYSLAPTGEVDSVSTTYAWKTPYFSYSGLASGQLVGSPTEPYNTKLNLARMISRYVSGAVGNVTMYHALQCSMDLDDTNTGNSDNVINNAPNTTSTIFYPLEQELHPSGLGKYISFTESANASSSPSQLDIYGMTLVYEQGGVY